MIIFFKAKLSNISSYILRRGHGSVKVSSLIQHRRSGCKRLNTPSKMVLNIDEGIICMIK